MKILRFFFGGGGVGIVTQKIKSGGKGGEGNRMGGGWAEVCESGGLFIV